jgi:hypothetical protein
MKAILLTTSLATLLAVIITVNNAAPVAANPYFLNRNSPALSDAALVQRYLEIDKIKLDIEMLECDRVFSIRPDHVIQKELDIANDRLKQITKIPQ